MDTHDAHWCWTPPVRQTVLLTSNPTVVDELQRAPAENLKLALVHVLPRLHVEGVMVVRPRIVVERMEAGQLSLQWLKRACCRRRANLFQDFTEGVPLANQPREAEDEIAPSLKAALFLLHDEAVLGLLKSKPVRTEPLSLRCESVLTKYR